MPIEISSSKMHSIHSIHSFSYFQNIEMQRYFGWSIDLDRLKKWSINFNTFQQVNNQYIRISLNAMF